MKESTSEELVAGIARGQREAFSELYDRCAARIHAFVASIVGRGPDAEDVLQEAFLQAWSQSAQFDPARGRAIAWLLQIARSRAVDHLRRQRSRHERDAGAPVPRPESHPTAEQRDVKVVTRGALSQLSEEQRAAISLAFYGGLTHEQVASRQDIPLGTAKQRIRRGMQRMRDMLNHKHEDLVS